MDGADFGVTLGKNIKLRREARGFSQALIAGLAGVSRATWSHLE